MSIGVEDIVADLGGVRGHEAESLSVRWNGAFELLQEHGKADARVQGSMTTPRVIGSKDQQGSMELRSWQAAVPSKVWGGK